MTMKICDLTQSYTSTSGGVRTYIDEKRRYIERNTDGEHVLIVPGEKDTVSREGRLTVHHISSPFIPGCKPYRMVLRLSRVQSILQAEKPDIIELGCAYTLPWAAFQYSRRHPVKVVGYYHTDFPTAYVENAISAALGKTSARTAKTIAEQYARIVYDKCDLTLVPSRMLRKKLIRSGVNRVEYMPLGVDTEIFAPSRYDPGLRSLLGIKPDHLMLVYAGRLDSEKRVHVLVEAVNLLPKNFPILLVLVGEGPLRKTLAATERESHRFVVVPYLSDKVRLASLLASADIYVTAGPFETFSLSVLEAQACGLPVIGVKSGALSERVTPQTGILGRVDDPADMAANILSLVSSDHRGMGREARALVEKNYSWERTFERLFAVYRSL